MNGQAAGIANIGDVIKHLQGVDEFATCIATGLQFEAHEAAFMRAVTRPGRDTLIEALRADPTVPADRADAIGRDLWQHCLQAQPHALMEDSP